ncbi:hypothetical protein HI914_02981 [Erysiphe necator]|nr:hypothetical protein HI914_02981 [Erysiphe necator]
MIVNLGLVIEARLGRAICTLGKERDVRELSLQGLVVRTAVTGSGKMEAWDELETLYVDANQAHNQS